MPDNVSMTTHQQNRAISHGYVNGACALCGKREADAEWAETCPAADNETRTPSVAAPATREVVTDALVHASWSRRPANEVADALLAKFTITERGGDS